MQRLYHVTDFAQAARGTFVGRSGEVTDCSFAGHGLCGMVTTRVLRWCEVKEKVAEPRCVVGFWLGWLGSGWLDYGWVL